MMPRARRHQLDAERVGDRLHRARRRRPVEPERAAEQVLGQVAEDDVGVRDRRQDTALAVRRRPRHRARRLRPDAQRPGEFGDVGDRAAAGPDRLDVERRRADRQVADVGRSDSSRLAVLDQRDVGRGAADVEGQDVLEPRVLRHPQGAGYPARRAAHQQRDGVLLGLLRTHQAAVGAEQRQPPSHLDPPQPVAQVADIGSDERPHRGVGDRRQRPLVLLHFGQDEVAERDRHVGQDLGGEGGDAVLVGAVDIGVDQTDRQCLDALALQRLERGADVGVVGRPDLDAGGR